MLRCLKGKFIAVPKLVKLVTLLHHASAHVVELATSAKCNSNILSRL